MTNGNGSELSERIAQRGREVVAARLRDAFAHQAAARSGDVDLDPTRLIRLIHEAAANAGEALWRRSLAEAVMEELGIDLSRALAHPALADAQALIDAGHGAPHSTSDALPGPPESTEDQPPLDAAPMVPDPHALHVSVVHLSGIETLPDGDDDLELRLSNAGLDVLKRSSGAAIGRLEWNEINTVALPPPKRGLRRRRAYRELHVSTGRGQALFGLPGLTDEELHEQLEPALTQRMASGNSAATGTLATAATGAAADTRDRLAAL